MQTFSLWVWYVIIVIIAWVIFILPRVGGLPILTGLLSALLLALIIGIVLLPYYITPLITDFDHLSIDIFITVSTLLPVAVLIIVLLSGEPSKYWKGGLRPDLTVLENIMHN